MTGEPKYTGRPYMSNERGLWYFKQGADGRTPILLANFAARIVADVVIDDGTETQRAFRIEADVRGQTKTVTVSANQFAAMNWPTEHLGAQAIVYPNQKDHARVAIQVLSKNPPEQRRYQHTGWRELDGDRVYIHAGGAIGKRGAKDVDTQFSPQMSHYLLPNPSRKPDIVAAVRDSLGMLDIAPDTVTFPIYAAIWRAILGGAAFSLHLSGLTGTGKSQLAALAQQHFGSGMDAQHLPASWTSTANALEGLAFQAKDTLLCVDDFVPLGNASDQQRLHRDADRLLRAQGNSTGRLRMTAEAQVKPAKPPRGIILSTGEELPKGQSLRARMVCVELAPDDLNFKKLTGCQQAAGEGRYAMAAAGFIRWLSVNYETAQKALQRSILAFRDKTADAKATSHRRTPDNLANLAAGLRIYLDFVRRMGAISDSQSEDYWRRALGAFDSLVTHQERTQETADPTFAFVLAIPTVLSSGRGHIAMTDGSAPENPGSLGWRKTGENWQPGGQRIGWYDPPQASIYLEPGTAYSLVQQVTKEAGDALTLSLSTLKRRLKQASLLSSTDDKRESVTIRRMIEGGQREVLHFSPALLSGENPTNPTFVGSSPETPSGGVVESLPNVGFSMSGNTPNVGFFSGNPTLITTDGSDSKEQNVGNVGFSASESGGGNLGTKKGKKRVSGSMSGFQKDPQKPDIKNPTFGALDEGFPQATAAVDTYFPGTMERFIVDLRQACTNGDGPPNDEELAAAVHRAYNRKAKSRGWFLATTLEALHDLRAERRIEEDRRGVIDAEFISNKCEHCGGCGFTCDPPGIETPTGGWSVEQLRPFIERGRIRLCACDQGAVWSQFIESTPEKEAEAWIEKDGCY